MCNKAGATEAAKKKPSAGCGEGKSDCPCVAPLTQNPNIETNTGPNDLGCGNYFWEVRFVLPEPSCEGGIIVQEIKIHGEHNGMKKPFTLHFWEAWIVSKHQTTSDWQQKYMGDDQYSGAPFPGLKGKLKVVGKVKFFEGMALPADFTPNNGATAAKDLPSTAQRPSFWDDTGTTHNLTCTWDCTGTNHKATIKTVPSSH